MALKIKRNNPVLIFLVVFGLLLFLHGLGVLRPLENFMSSLAKPLGVNLYGLASAWPARTEKLERQALEAEISSLKEEVARLNVSNSRCQDIAAENTKLRGQLNFSQTSVWRSILADIIARESPAAGEERRDLVIDKGSQDGLRPGLAVISETGAVVGKVVETKSTTAKICLTVSPDCQLAASVQNSSRTQGLTNGDLGLTVKMEYIPQLEEIAVSDLVVTSGLGGDIPRGLVIGRISSVSSENNDVWQSATIEPLIDFNDLTVVGVVLP